MAQISEERAAGEFQHQHKAHSQMHRHSSGWGLNSQQHTVRTHCRIRTEKSVSGCSDDAPTHSHFALDRSGSARSGRKLVPHARADARTKCLSAGDYSDERVALFAANFKFD